MPEVTDQNNVKWQHDNTKSTEGEVLQLLYALVSATKPETCLETGTYAGKGAGAIARALEANGKGHLETVESDVSLYKQYRGDALPRTTFIYGDSLDWARKVETVDFAFIDCGEPDHRLAVAIELKPKVHGLLLMHDTNFYGQMLHAAEQAIGPCSLNFPTLFGLAVWDCK